MLGKRFEAVRTSKGLSKRQFAILIKVVPSYITEIEEGNKIPGGNIIFALKEKIPNLDMNWLIAGEGEMYLPDPGEPIEGKDTMSALLNIKSNLANLSKALDKVPSVKPYFRFKRLEKKPFFKCEHDQYLKAAGAGGKDLEDLSPEEWKQFIVKKKSMVPEKVTIGIPIEGRSMEPTILDHAVVLCRKVPFQEIKHNDLVVFQDLTEEKFKLRRVKCIQKKDEDPLCILTADNPEYDDSTLLDENIRIEGVVIYCANKVQ